LSARAERASPGSGPGAVRGALHGLAGAAAFLTIVPVPRPARTNELDLAGAVPWFPLVGAAVGAAAGGVRVALEPLLGRGPSSASAIAVLVVITGALHQDGLADTSDGLGVRGGRARKLAVMRESTVGAYGVLALVIWALLLFTALQGLSAEHALRALLAAGALSRLAPLLHVIAAPPARREGLGAGLRPTGAGLFFAVVLGAGAAIAAAGPARGGLSLAVCAAIAALTGLLARRAFGGSTGDTLGAAVSLTELTVCLALLASWR
jgi:adenosylcobinamide-GDP ribazoletransferase